MTPLRQAVVGLLQAARLAAAGPTGATDPTIALDWAARCLYDADDGEFNMAMEVFCRRYLARCQHQGFDMATNGEGWLLGRLAPTYPTLLIDAGAHEGSWTLAAAAALPGAAIHAFEILPETRARLRDRTAHLTQVTVAESGLGALDGLVPMQQSFQSSQFTSPIAYAPNGPYAPVECAVVAGDRYLAERGIDHIDLLKVDVEGGEPLVFEGLRQTLARGAIDIIQFEYGEINIINHFLLYDFYQLLNSLGYVIGRLTGSCVMFKNYDFKDENFSGSNYVACRRDRHDLLRLLGEPTAGPAA